MDYYIKFAKYMQIVAIRDAQMCTFEIDVSVEKYVVTEIVT